MRRTVVLFAAIAVLASALFVRLGIWQLQRLGERHARNSLVEARLDLPAVEVGGVPLDTGLARFRRATVTGRPDYAHEFVITAKSHGGSPGVFLLTPVLREGSDTAVIVNRGWVYSPDAATVQLDRWHEPDSLTTFEGFMLPLAEGGGPATITGNQQLLRSEDRDAIVAVLPYPIFPAYLVATADSSVRADASIVGRPARLAVPPLDSGPHMGYAIQWFAFALIALAGTGIIIFRGTNRREGPDGARDATIPLPPHLRGPRS